MKISNESIGVRTVGLAVDGFIGCESVLVVGIGIETRALIVDHVCESVIEVGQADGRPGGDQVLDKITAKHVAAIHTPLREVSYNLWRRRMRLFIRRARRLLAKKRDGSQQQNA